MEELNNKNGENSLFRMIKVYFRKHSEKQVKQVEGKLNSMAVSERKRWFVIVFSLLFLGLLFKFVWAIHHRPNNSTSVVDAITDSIIDWRNVNLEDLHVINIDSLAKEISYVDSLGRK